MAMKEPGVSEEGAYLAAVEEFVEASLFYQFVTTGKIDEVKAIRVSGESYLAGLCDVPGELYRYAIAAATRHDIEMVKRCNELAGNIIGELIEFNLTSYLRNKFDQAKGAAQKLEQVMYEVSLRM
jgi:predicted translin family RNA/ssDNA-binding protein